MAIVQLRGIRRQQMCHPSQMVLGSAQPYVHVLTTGVLQSLQHKVRPACVFQVPF